MYMQIRLPLACFLIMLYCGWYFGHKKRLRTRASQLFTVLLELAIVNLSATTVTEYTVHHRDTVPVWANYLWHVLFLCSLTCFCALLLYYLLLLIERNTMKHQWRDKCVLVVVWALGVLTQMVLPIEYVDTPQGSYSLGPKAYSLYVVVAYVLIVMIWKLAYYWKLLEKEKRSVLLMSVIIFLTVSVIQMIFPHVLLTSLAVTMIMLGLIVNMEDANLYVSYQTGMYNELGCREIIQEKVFLGKPFRLCAYVFTGEENDVLKTAVALDSAVARQGSWLMSGLLAENMMIVLPLTGWIKSGNLPDQLPEPAAENGVRYHAQVFEFNGTETFDVVLSVLRGFRSRCMAEDFQRDELTGLLRRENFARQIEGMLERETPFSLLMIDLDNFKSINDTFGHGAGDQVLQAAANVFRTGVRSSDVVCRMGGDEFAIALSGIASPEEVRPIVARMSDKLQHQTVLPDPAWRVCISVGAKICLPAEERLRFKIVYEQADMALYQVKKSGKNNIAFFEG